MAIPATASTKPRGAGHDPMAKHSEIASVQFSRVIPEIDIWRGAKLMLKR
jgi:hypothetical protein